MSDKEIIRAGDPRRPPWIPDDLDVYIEDGIWREPRYGQYVLPRFNPDKEGMHDGVGRTWQRTTTLISMAEYQGEGLTDWRIRYALKGTALKPELFARAVLTELPDKITMDKDRQAELKAIWREIAAEAHHAAGGDEANENGTDIHMACELVDKGLDPADLPQEFEIKGRTANLWRWRKHAAAYVDLRNLPEGEGGFDVYEELIERTVNPGPYGDVGTFDRLVLFRAPKVLTDRLGLPPDTEPRWTMLDFKSGDVDYRDKMGRQMLRYAQGDAIWNFQKNEYEWLPGHINKDYGLLVHLPYWEDDPQAVLIPIPYAGVGGAEGLELAFAVKKGRSKRAPVMREIAWSPAPSKFTDAVTPVPITTATLYPTPTGGEPIVLDTDGRAPESAIYAEINDTTSALLAAERNDATIDPGEFVPYFTDSGAPASEASLDQINPNANAHKLYLDQPDPPSPEDREAGLIAAGLDPTGEPLAPFPAEGKKGCSVCRRTGHRKGSPRCWGEKDPAIVVAAGTPAWDKLAAERGADIPEAEPAPGTSGGSPWGELAAGARAGEPEEHTFRHSTKLDPAFTAVRSDPPRFCPGHLAAGFHEAGKSLPGLFVCAECELPTEAAFRGWQEAMGHAPAEVGSGARTIITSEAMTVLAASDRSPGDLVEAGLDRTCPTCLSDDPAQDGPRAALDRACPDAWHDLAAPPPANVMSRDEYWVQLIRAAQNPDAVLAVGRAAKDRDELTDTVKEAGKARLQAVRA